MDELAARADGGAAALQAALLGRSFHCFDPARDPGLEGRVLEIARGIAEAMPVSAAMGGAAVRAAGRRRMEMKHGERKSRGRAGLAAAFNAAANAAPAPDGKAEERRSLVRFIHPESVLAENRTLGGPFPFLNEGGRWREEIGRGALTFCKVIDEQERTRALFCIETGANGQTLKSCRGGGGHLPDPASLDCIRRYAQAEKMRLAENAADTGLFRCSGEGIRALGAIPPGLTSHEPLHIAHYDGPLSLENLKRILGPEKSVTVIDSCPQLASLGGLEFSRGALHVTDCEGLESLGALHQVGMSGTHENISLSLRGCRRLRSLGRLREVHGNLDLRGTGIDSLPSSLARVKGYVYTDAGAFRYLGPGRRWPLAPVKFVPPPEAQP
jgi:hypothetical protein